MTRALHRLLGAVPLIGVLWLGAQPALAAGPPPSPSPAGQGQPNPSNPAGREMLGIVPVRGQLSKTAGAGGNLTYHGGPIMHTNRVYTIFWAGDPTQQIKYPFSADYQTVINRFFADVAATPNDPANVYYSTTQYTNGSGVAVQNSSTFAGTYVDTNQFPTSGCKDQYTSICLTDGQLGAEINTAINAAGWTASSDAIYFMFTPKGVGSCYGSSCAFSNYCAYHSWMGSGSSVILYANMPYADTVPAACDAGQHPNNSDADATLNVTSHEHAEAMTDPQGSAWYDRRGYENADKCAWNFGAALGTAPNGQKYNQKINGNFYYLQQDWSNKSSGCVLTGQ